MDEEILKTVESMLGKNVKIVDCEKTSSVREEEILLINGIPVTLEGNDGDAIKTALMTGQVPPCDLLNQLLYQAGILRQPVQLETSLSVKSTMVTKEEVTVARDGRILDERTSETKEDNYYTSSCKEIWEPVNSVSGKKQNIPIKTNSNPPNELLSPVASDEGKNAGKQIHSKKRAEEQYIPNDSIINKSSTIAPSPSLSSSPISSSSTPGGHNCLYTTTDSPITTGSEPASSYSSIATNCSGKLSTDLYIQEVPNHLHNLIVNNNNGSRNKLDCKNFLKNPSISYDSGHDDIYNSLSHGNVLQSTNTGNSISSCYDFTSSDEADFINKSPESPTDDRNSSLFMPTIFGTVASDQCPKDSVNRRGLPQTTGKCVGEQQHSTLSPSISADSYKEILDADENALVYRDGNLISGPLDGLIQHMVPTSDYYPDRSYLFAFLLSARLFIRPHELLAKICQLCDEQQNISQKSPDGGHSAATDAPSQNPTHAENLDHHQHQDDGGVDENTSSCGSDGGDCCRRLRAFAQHFVQLLTEWIETFPYDFRDDRLMQHVRAMTRKCINIDSNVRKDVSVMLQNLMHRLAVLEKYEEFLQSLAKGTGECRGADLVGLIGITSKGSGSGGGITGTGHMSSSNPSMDQQQNLQHQNQHQQPQHTSTLHPVLQPNSTNTSSSSLTSNTAATTAIDISELCPNPTLLAHQLTHIELERLSHIGPEEFVQAFAKENPHLEQSFSDMKKTRNLESYVQWFNRLSYLVATEIVKHPKKKQRVRVVEYWIETARECFNIGNFNSLMAIIAGLNMSPISRLKKTWAKVQSAKFAVLEHQMDPSSNFNSYRSTLKAAMWRSAGATDERERIVIPFFSLLVKDLYFLNEGCSNKLPNGHINFEKFWQLAKQVTEFIAWKQVTCPFEKIPKVIMFLQTNHVLNENTLAMASFECEPPENHEKDRYKCLKSEQQMHHHHHQQ